MPRRRGKTLDLTFTYQRIDVAISSLNEGCFTPKEIYEISRVNEIDIYRFLSEKTKKGLLERMGRGCYKKVSGGNLTQKLPEAFVATKVWEVLHQSDKKPLTNREISQIITEDTGLDLYSNIGVLLFTWFRRNALNKFGAKQPYAYQIKPHCKSRPSTSLPF